MEILEQQRQETVWKRPKLVEELRVRTRLGAKGRLVIDGELRIVTLRETIRRVQERARRYVKPGTLVSDELSAERREAAKHE